MKALRQIALAGLLCVSGPALSYEPSVGSFDFNRAMFKHYSRDHLSAASAALALPEQDASTRAFIGANLLDYGMYMEAQRILRPLLAEGSLSAANRAELWLTMATRSP